MLQYLQVIYYFKKMQQLKLFIYHPNHVIELVIGKFVFFTNRNSRRTAEGVTPGMRLAAAI